MSIPGMILMVFAFVLMIFEAGGATFRGWHPGWLGAALVVLAFLTAAIPALGR